MAAEFWLKGTEFGLTAKRNQGCLGKIRTRKALFSVKHSVVLNANNPLHLSRVKLNCAGFSHLQHILQVCYKLISNSKTLAFRRM